jgi:23S rRNA (pseudouridine1915-N3)-methyltransferase
MQFEFIFIGKTADSYLVEGIEIFRKKLTHYMNVKISIIPQGLGKAALKTEADTLLHRLNKTDYLILLDEQGKELTSVKFAETLQKILNLSRKKIVFLIGSSYGLHDSLRERADLIVSFSRLTFTHQMIRLLLLEQVYRAMTILKGEKYHH